MAAKDKKSVIRSRYAAVNKEVKKLKLSSLKVGYNDLMFLAISLLFVAVSLLVSTLI